MAQAGTTHITDQHAAPGLHHHPVLYIVAVNPNNVTGVLTLQSITPGEGERELTATKELNTVGFYQALITHFILEANIYCHNY